MASCARCSRPLELATDAPAPTLTLCPEHVFSVLEDVRRHLATTLAPLERAISRAIDVLASGAGG
jgi:hypothetical protein